MATPDFRAQARAVRAEARKKLMDYRRERRAGMRVAPAPAPVAGTDESAGGVDSPAAVDASCLAEIAQDDRPVEMQVSAIAAAFAEAATLGRDDASPSACDAIHDEGAPSAETAMAPEQPVAAEAGPTPAPEQQPVEPAANEAEAAAPAALDALPGVGPGLVWLLQKAGVDSIDALLASDTHTLSERLGLVGRLVDVAALQAMARSARP